MATGSHLKESSQRGREFKGRDSGERSRSWLVMKYAIVSDIHSNLVAFKAVLRDIASRGGVDGVWCLGDTVGYGPDPNGCVDLLRNQNNLLCVAGNHDLGAVKKIVTSTFNFQAEAACKWNGDQLGKKQHEFLANLPTMVGNEGFTLVHGSPRDPVWEYVGMNNAWRNFNYFYGKVCLVGHSHVPEVWELLPNGEVRARLGQHGGTVKIGRNRLILNPGSVGQSRDGDKRASYAIYNDETQVVVFYRVKYDFKEARRREVRSGLRGVTAQYWPEWGEDSWLQENIWDQDEKCV